MSRLRFLKGPDAAAALFVEGAPRMLRVNGRQQPIQAVLDHWRVEDEWWTEEPIARLYYEVLLPAGRKLVFWAPFSALRATGEVAVFLGPG